MLDKPSVKVALGIIGAILMHVIYQSFLFWLKNS